MKWILNPLTGELQQVGDEDIVQNNISGNGPPTVNDDSSNGYTIQSKWYDITSTPREAYICLDATVGAAVWSKISLETSDLGSMAMQFANNVAITGGSINGTTIGASTPAAGTFTSVAAPVSVITDSATGNVTPAQMQGQTHVITGAYTLSLPTAAVGYNATFMASTAAVFSIDVVTGTDVIVLNGNALTAGNKITSDGTIYAECYVECNLAGKYIITTLQGIFIDGGA